MNLLQTVGPGIYALDTAYVRPRFDAIHFIEHGGRLAIVDSGTVHTVPRVLEAVKELGFAAEAVDWVLLTHVHLDHAGGAGALIRELPNARLGVHGRGAPHMIDPAKLWASTVQVYGESFASQAYGELVPVEAARVAILGDGEAVDLAGRALQALDTPGHARHHLCFLDELSRGIFTGDTFGLSYRELDVNGRCFVFPTTTPVHFDPQALHASIDRLLSYDPACMYLTHYSRVGEVPRLADDMHRLVDACVAVAEAAATLPDERSRLVALRKALCELVREEADHSGWALRGDAAADFFIDDIELNAQGLLVWLTQKERRAATERGVQMQQ